MFQLHQIIYGSFLLDDQCIFINALIHSIVSHNLCPIQTTAFRRESNLDVHLQGTGIVAGMRTRVNGCRQIRHTKSFQTLGRKSRRSHSQVKYFRYGSPDRAFIFHPVAKCHVVGYDTCLTIGRSGQEVQPRLTGNRMRIFNGITYGIHRLIGSLQVFIYINTLHFS